jgi:hypothetical protein
MNINKQIDLDGLASLDGLVRLEEEFNNIGKKKIPTIKLSQEQDLIIETNSNIIVDAVAGSGKTTTILHMALKYPNKNLLQITYNNMLKHEVRKKVRNYSIENLNIHTYHSLAVKFYDPSAYTDEEIKKVLLSNKQICNKPSKPYDIILIDETQDMMTDYYLLIKKFIKDQSTGFVPLIMIFGDRYQGIYEFKGANTKFLTLADKLWDCEFTKLNLSTSYRLTDQIGWFVNNVMLGYNRINTNKSGPVVDYYICSPYKIYELVGKQIIKMIKHDGIKEEDIFVLSPSIKSENPYKKLENYLVSNGLKCMTPISDDAKLDDTIINNKIVFTTYHQAKGRERKVVILYNFDNSYFKYYLRGENQFKCPNILYVGATRASYKLILIRDYKFEPLQFLNTKHSNLNKYLNIITTEFNGLNNLSNISNNKDITDHKTSVTELIKFIDSNIMDMIVILIKDLFLNLSEQINVVDVPCKIEIKTEYNNVEKISYEDVSDLNGLVIPSIYEKAQNNFCTIEDYVINSMNKIDFNEIKKYVKKVNLPCIKISDYLKVGNIYSSLNNKLHSKLAQIKKYKWLTKKMIVNCHKNMSFLDNSNLQFEKNISNCEEDVFKYIHKEHGIIKIAGRIDAYDNNSVYEFKCVDNISIDHKLQLILYAWLWSNSDLYKKYGSRDFKLLNIKTGELLKLVNDQYKINQIVELIFSNKFVKRNVLLDDEFISTIKSQQSKLNK